MHLGWDEEVKAYVLMIFGSLYIYVVMMDEAFSVGMGWACLDILYPVGGWFLIIWILFFVASAIYYNISHEHVHQH
jgi:hypothetical protein